METPDTEEVDVAAMFDLSLKKKKKKKKTTEGDAPAEGTPVEGTPAVEVEGPPTYSYNQLLQRVVDLLHENNPELTDRRRPTMKPPQLMKGTS